MNWISAVRRSLSSCLVHFPLKKISGSKRLDLPLKSVVLATNKLNKSSQKSKNSYKLGIQYVTKEIYKATVVKRTS